MSDKTLSISKKKITNNTDQDEIEKAIEENKKKKEREAEDRKKHNERVKKQFRLTK